MNPKAAKETVQTFAHVRNQELDEIKKHSPKCDENNLTGLALSGGGIRSATFNLGLIQALAKNGLLSKFNYLSAVSGGGYCASWLTSWAYRKEKENTSTTANGITQVQEILKENRDPSDNPSKPEPEPVAWLRRYSNYLTPRKGLFSLDTLTGVTYHIRNVFLSSLTTGLFVFGAMALLAGIIKAADDLDYISHTTLAGLVSFAGLAIGFIAAVWLWYRLPLVSASMPPRKTLVCSFLRKRAVEIIALLIVVHSIILGIVGITPFFTLAQIPWILGVGYSIAALIGISIAALISSKKASSTHSITHKTNWTRLYLSIIPGAIPFLVLGSFLHEVRTFLALSETPTSWELAGITAPLVCLLVSFAASIHLGIVGRAIHSEAYFWASRVAGRMAQFSIAFAFPAVAFLVFPTLLDWSEAKLSIGGAGVMFAIIARWLAASPSTGKVDGKKSKWQKMASEGVISVAPFILILLLVGFTAWGIRDGFATGKQEFNGDLLKYHQYTCQEKTVPSENVVAKATPLTPEHIEFSLRGEQIRIVSGCIPSLRNYYALNIKKLNSIEFPGVFWCGYFSLILTMILARLINANLFSLHSYYKNRLTNAYLAASNQEINNKKLRDIDIGVHPSDAIPLQELANISPYLLINTTLNLVGKESNLAWQDRKAASFVMSPLYCGYAIESMKDGHKEYFQPTGALKDDPIKLNLAMTISGAAGSPMGGFHTKPGVSMLLALAGVRLGWWFSNPRRQHTGQEESCAWRKTFDALQAKFDTKLGGPDTSLLTTFPKELFGKADEEGNVVYLSDGGHFENLGIYELVRRRCALIVASDASADPNFLFDDLARAIHNVRTDFGVEIEIDTSSLRPQPNADECKAKAQFSPERECQFSSEKSNGPNYQFSPDNFVVGTIKYSTSPIEEIREAKDGVLIYIKSSLPLSAKKEAADILYYASTHEEFPHEPTSDQWFSEEQFEAYRKLGSLIGEKAAKTIENKLPA